MLTSKRCPIDHRYDNERFWLSRHNCEVPTPNSQNNRTTRENSDFSTWRTLQLHASLKCTIPNLRIYLSKKANSDKFGPGIDHPCTIGFWFRRWTSSWRRVIWAPYQRPSFMEIACFPSKHEQQFCTFVSLYETLKIWATFSRENRGHGAHERGVRRGFSGGKLSFKMSEGVAYELGKKTPIFASLQSNLKDQTVFDFPSFLSSLLKARPSNRITKNVTK